MTTGASHREVVASSPVTSALGRSERLSIAHRKRLYHSYGTNSDGARELRIDYGDKEITFDEVHLFSFAERLVHEPSFTGDDATRWGSGYSWDEIRPLLESLLGEGILRRHGDDVREPRGGGAVTAPLPPSVCPVARTWSLAECESISRDLTGHAFEIGYLEAVVPVYRVAHPALDADGRQVGEGNVFPPRLRMDIATEWRVCQYSGSRYRDDLPMNVTALKAMIKHWKPMMATLVRIRAALRDRLGPPATEANGRWTIGELHLLSCIVLAVAGYPLMKVGGSSPQRPLHPVLSSLFRITDGIRMATHQMLFSVAHTRRADEPLSAAQLFDHAEINATLIGGTGVCAGPKALIDEFLAIAVDGAPAEGIEDLVLPTEIEAVLAELSIALEYGLYGMQSWPASAVAALDISRCYEAVLPIIEVATAAAHGNAACARLVARLRADQEVLEKLQIAVEHDRDVHLRAYADSYERSWHALHTKVGAPRLADALAPVAEGPAHRAAADQLRALLTARALHGELAGVFDPTTIERLVEPLVTLLRSEQAALGAAAAIQEAINGVLDRQRPTRPLSTRDLLSFYALHPVPGPFPGVFDTLGAELDFRVDTTASVITITDLRAR